MRELDYNVVACTRKQILRLQDISKGSGLYFYPSQWQSGKITACHPKGLRFDSRTGHLGCGHYVVMSCTLGCFHSYPRLRLTFTIIVLSKYFNIRYGLWCVYIWCSFRHVWTQKGAYSDPCRNVSNRNPHGSHAKLCYLHYCQAS